MYKDVVKSWIFVIFFDYLTRNDYLTTNTITHILIPSFFLNIQYILITRYRTETMEKFRRMKFRLRWIEFWKIYYGRAALKRVTVHFLQAANKVRIFNESSLLFQDLVSRLWNISGESPLPGE